MPVVAISREIGTGAAEIAQQLARMLGAELLDRRIIDEVARRLRICPEEAERIDERPESLLERILCGMSGVGTGIGPADLSYGLADEWSWTPPYAGDPGFGIHRASRRVTEEVIKEGARLGNVVIVGRGAAYLLKDEPQVLRVFLRAPSDDRALALMQRLGLDAKAAADRVKESDANWGAYLRDTYRVDWRDPANYDLVLDTGRLGGEAAAQIIRMAVMRLG